MTLIFILLICFSNFSFSEYDTYIKGGETVTLSGYKGYIDLSDYTGYYRLKSKVTVKNGYFYDNYMKLGGSFYKPDSWNSYKLSERYNTDSEEHGTKTGSNYDYYTKYFSIPKDSYWNYYYLEFPSYSGKNIEVKIDSSGISVFIIILIVVIFIALIIGIFFFIRYKKRQQLSYIAPPIPVNQPLMNPGYNQPYPQVVQPNYPPQTI